MKKFTFILITGIILFAMTPSANATVGVRLGTYTDAEELFIGGEVVTPVSMHFYFNPNIEYIFLENTTFLTFNADFHYDFVETERTFIWGGAGLGIQYFDYEGNNSTTEAGLNLLLGIGLKARGNVIPYLQGKFILGDYDDFAIGVGIRF